MVHLSGLNKSYLIQRLLILIQAHRHRRDDLVMVLVPASLNDLQ